MKKLFILIVLILTTIVLFASEAKLVVQETFRFPEIFFESFDGNYYLVGGRVGLQLFNKNGKLIRNFPQSRLNGVYLTKDNSKVVTYSTKGNIKIFNTTSGELITEFIVPKYGTMIVDKEEKYIIIPKNYYEINWYNFSGSIIKTKSYPSLKNSKDRNQNITKMILSKDKELIFCSSGNNLLYCINNEGDLVFNTKQKYFSGTCSGDNPISIINNSDCASISYLSIREQNIKIFDINGKVVSKFFLDEFARYFSSSPNENIAVISYEVNKWEKKGIKIINIKDGSVIKTIKDIYGEIYFSNDGEYFVVLDKESLFFLSPKGEIIQKISNEILRPNQIYCLNNNEFISLGNDLFKLDLENLSIKNETKKIITYVSSSSISPDGLLCAIGGDKYGDRNGYVELYDSNLNFIKSLNLTGRSVICGIAISPDNNLLATISYSDYVDIWDISSGKNLIKYKNGHIGDRHGIIFAPDGKSIYFALSYKKQGSDRNSYDKIMQMDLSGNVIRSFNNSNGASHLRLTPNGGSIVASGSPGNINFFSFDGQLIRSMNQISRWSGPTSFSKDGKYMTSGYSYSRDNKMKVWDIENNKLANTITNMKETSINSIVFLKENRYLLSSANNRISLWNREKGKKLLSLIFCRENDWVVTTPDGFFDCSEGAKEYIYWVKGLEIFELDQFFDDFYRPGLLAEVISSEEIERPNINIADKLHESPPPKVEIISPMIGEKFSQQTIEVKIKITDNGGGIDEVKILHNGKRVSGDSRGIKIKTSGNSIYRTFSVSLLNGNNEFIASAFSLGRIESHGYKIEVLYEGTSKTADSYILAVGINQYKNKQLNLNYARTDAEAFVKLVVSKSQNLFNNVEVSTLYDIDANRQNILKALDDIALKAKPEDVFTFYYAGHGSVVDNRYYFVSSENVKLYDRVKLDRDAIYVKDLQEKLSNIKALKQLVVIDACQSGAATELLALRGAAEEKALAQLARSAGVHILASSGSEQYATEFQALGHGVFTYTLLQGLKGKANGSPKDNKITIYELKAYLDDQVPLLTEKYKGETQWPNTFSKGQDFPITLER